MADNYTLLSAALHVDTPEQKAWIEKYLPLIEQADDELFNPLLEELKREAEVLDLLGAWDEVNECVYQGMNGPECSIDDCDDDESKHFLWIRSEDNYGSLEGLANLILIWMHKFKITKPFGMQWADTCSKPRLDEFGGGAVLITTNGNSGIYWMSTSQWLDEQAENLGSLT